MVKVSIQFKRPPGTARAVFQAALVEGRRAMLLHWHEQFVPVHFTRAAYKRYGYQPRAGQNEPPRITRIDGKPGTRRNPKYYWAKWARKRHDDPLVYSGDSRRAATNPANFELRNMSGQRTRGVFVNLPDYWYRYHKAGVYWRRHMHAGMQAVVINQQPKKADELTSVTNAEAEELRQVGGRVIRQHVRRFAPPASLVA